MGGLLEDFRRNKYGPAQLFSPYDVPRAVFRLERRKGRARLSEELGVGEGSARSILNFLKGKGLIDSRPQGHKLTEKGFALLAELQRKARNMKPFNGNELTYGKPGFGALTGKKLDRPSKLRPLMDKAVRAGAYGSTFLISRKGKFGLIGLEKENSRFRRALAELERSFSPEDGEVLALCYGEKFSAERALWAVVLD